MKTACSLLLLLAVVCTAAQAHPLAPALLELRETAPSQYDVLWRTSVARARRTDVEPRLPSHCVPAGPVRTVLEEGERLAARWPVNCGARGIAGQVLGVAGLAQSGVNVIVRIEDRFGHVAQGLLDAATTDYSVPAAAVPSPVLQAYFALGVEHLLLGFDHVLFVLGLLLLLWRTGLRRLLWTVTAFTFGHSITLALATLGLVSVNPSVTELGIALSILALACELASGRPGLLARRPALMALAFGLLHGLGFAGALAELGLPQDAIPLALLSFNLGIEAGQVLLILALLPLRGLARRAQAPRLAQALPVYVIGGLAAMWCFERAVELRF